MELERHKVDTRNARATIIDNSRCRNPGGEKWNYMFALCMRRSAAWHTARYYRIRERAVMSIDRCRAFALPYISARKTSLPLRTIPTYRNLFYAPRISESLASFTSGLLFLNDDRRQYDARPRNLMRCKQCNVCWTGEKKKKNFCGFRKNQSRLQFLLSFHLSIYRFCKVRHVYNNQHPIIRENNRVCDWVKFVQGIRKSIYIRELFGFSPYSLLAWVISLLKIFLV